MAPDARSALTPVQRTPQYSEPEPSHNELEQWTPIQQTSLTVPQCPPPHTVNLTSNVPSRHRLGMNTGAEFERCGGALVDTR